MDKTQTLKEIIETINSFYDDNLLSSQEEEIESKLSLFEKAIREEIKSEIIGINQDESREYSINDARLADYQEKILKLFENKKA